MTGRALTMTVVLVAACSQERIGVSTTTADYNHGALRAAVDAFVAAQRTPDAFAALAQQVLALRGGMDRSVADQAELKLVVLALAPLQAVGAKPMSEQVDALALTVWPTLITPRIEADALVVKRDPRAIELLPKRDEDARAYLQRLCGGPLAGDCKQVVPEYQGHAVAALAIRRATERARNAVAGCLMCTSEPGWRDAVRQWEALDRAANTSIHEIERKASPDNWPIAGGASAPDPGLPEAEVTPAGEIIIGGQRYGAPARIDALRELRFMRGEDGPIALHVRPETTLAQLRALAADAKKSGAPKIAVLSREPQYPWERRIYWIAEGVGQRSGLRPTDSVQLLLHTMDHLAAPGAVARLD